MVRQLPLEPARSGGPNLHRLLRVTRLPSGHFCLDIETGHADPGSDTVSSHVEASQEDHSWEKDSEGDERLLPLLLDADRRGCVEVSGSMVVIGAGDAEYAYAAAGQFGRGCPDSR